MVFVQNNKYYLANYLVDQLDPTAKYTKEEIENFIIVQVAASTFQEPTMAVDHLWMAMVDNRFLARDVAGHQYWVAETFIKPSDEEDDNVGKMQSALIKVGEETKYYCRQCAEKFKNVISLTRHYIRNHTYLRHRDKIDKYLN